MLKTFFVFNVHFARQSVVALTLLQHTVLGIDGSLSAKAMKHCCSTPCWALTAACLPRL